MEVENGAEAAPVAAPRRSPHAIPAENYGWLSRLRSYLILDPLIWLYTLVLGMLALPGGLFDRSGRRLHWFSRAWSWLIMKTIFSPVKVTGLDKIDTSKPHVYAVNHASAMDIPVLYVYLPFQFRIVFKKELLSYPIVGWQLKRSGQVCIDQQKPTNSIAAIRSAVKSLKAGMPLVIYPEGGRTPDGEIKPFLPGAFFLAIKAQVDIVPVALVGTYELLPMNTYHIKCRPLEMRVGEPISTAGLTMRDLEAVSAKVQKAMEDLYYSGSPVRHRFEFSAVTFPAPCRYPCVRLLRAENPLKALEGPRKEADERLLIEAAQKDPARFAELYENNFERVYAYVVRRVGDRAETEDLTSEVFHHALANLQRFEWRGIPFAAWLYRIAANLISDRWQRNEPRRSGGRAGADRIRARPAAWNSKK